MDGPVTHSLTPTPAAANSLSTSDTEAIAASLFTAFTDCATFADLTELTGFAADVVAVGVVVAAVVIVCLLCK